MSNKDKVVKQTDRGSAVRGLAVGASVALLLLCSQQVAAADGTNMTFKGVLVNPPVCTIEGNGTSDINVTFDGRMPIGKIDGVNFMKQVGYTIKCGDGTQNLDLKLTLTGTKAAFGDGVLQAALTTEDGGSTIDNNFGVQVLYGASKTPFTLDKTITIDNNPANKPELWAVPTKKAGSTLIPGQFTATATLKAEYQ